MWAAAAACQVTSLLELEQVEVEPLARPVDDMYDIARIINI